MGVPMREGVRALRRSGRAAGPLIAIGLVTALAIGQSRALRADSGGADPQRSEPEHIVLLHGLARGSGSMKALEARLASEGYHVHNIDYPSTRHGPDALVDLLADRVRACCHGQRVHFVTHSLGGILARALIERRRPTRVGRVVQIAPPNGGSEIVDFLGETSLFAFVFGPTAVQLGTDAGSFPNRLGRPDYALGVIAGRLTVNPVGSAMLPGGDDGAVTIASAALEGAADFLLVDATHTFIMRNDEVIEQVVHFLRHGAFRRAQDGPGDEAPTVLPSAQKGALR